jgi:hypothetical protein
MSDDEHSLLARLDERVKSVQEDQGTMTTYVAAEFVKLHARFDEYVRLERYRTIEIIVFGVAGLILSGVFAAIIATVVHR